MPLLLAGLIAEFAEHGNGSSTAAQIYATLLIVCILASVLLTHPYMMGMMVRSPFPQKDWIGLEINVFFSNYYEINVFNIHYIQSIIILKLEIFAIDVE